MIYLLFELQLRRVDLRHCFVSAAVDGWEALVLGDTILRTWCFLIPLEITLEPQSSYQANYDVPLLLLLCSSLRRFDWRKEGGSVGQGVSDHIDSIASGMFKRLAEKL